MKLRDLTVRTVSLLGPEPETPEDIRRRKLEKGKKWRTKNRERSNATARKRRAKNKRSKRAYVGTPNGYKPSGEVGGERQSHLHEQGRLERRFHGSLPQAQADR